MDTVEDLHRQILNCRLCQDGGFIQLAAPVVAGRAESRIMLIGQAPGVVELEVRRPFQGKAGRQLFRWLESIGIEEEDFRQHVYMTSITKCFPGRSPSGSGDRRPSPREIELCKPFLDRQLALIAPQAILLVGGLAIERYLTGKPLADLIGRRFKHDGCSLVPLPHPSGASRWLNVPEHKELLVAALALVREEWERLVLPRLERKRVPALVG